jgi:hypothetical protein
VLLLVAPGNRLVGVIRVDDEGISPIRGITGTPVIDPATNTLYVLADIEQNGRVYKLHALDSDGCPAGKGKRSACFGAGS